MQFTSKPAYLVFLETECGFPIGEQQDSELLNLKILAIQNYIMLCPFLLEKSLKECYQILEIPGIISGKMWNLLSWYFQQYSLKIWESNLKLLSQTCINISPADRMTLNRYLL